MQLIQAKITGQPRTVTTKHGDRSVVDQQFQIQFPDSSTGVVAQLRQPSSLDLIN